MDQSPTIDQLVMRAARPAPRLTKGHLLMAVVLISLGYFLIWPVLLLLINSFNAATTGLSSRAAGE